MKNKFSNFLLPFFFITFFFLSSVSSQTIFTQWDFESAFTPATPEPSTGIGNASVVGSMTGPGTAAGSTTGCTQAAGTGSWALGTANPGPSENSSGVQFLVSTVGFTNIKFSYDHRFSNAATRTVRVQYTTDGGTNWINFDVDTSNYSNACVNRGGIDLGRIDVTDPVGNNASDSWSRRYIDFTGVSNVAENPNFGIRLVAGYYSTTGEFRQANNVNNIATAGTWRFDNVTFEGTPLTPNLSTNPLTLSNLNYQLGGGPSASQFYDLTGLNLSPAAGNITVTAPANFEVSTDDINFSASVMIAYTGGTLAATPVYVRLVSGLGVGSYSGDVTNVGGTANVDVAVSGNVTPALTSIIMPQYISTGGSNSRMPMAFLLQIDGLLPNSTYKFNHQVIDSLDGPTTTGAGNTIYTDLTNTLGVDSFTYSTSTNFANAGQHGEFMTDAMGSYIGWFITVPTGNARFTPGRNIWVRIRLNDGLGGTNIVTYLTSDQPVFVLDWGTTSGSSTQGSLFWGNSTGDDPGIPRNILLSYSDTLGSGRPLSSTIIQGDGLDLTADANFVDTWRTNVDEQNGRWGLLIPNNNTNGVRRLEERSLYQQPIEGILDPGEIVKFITSSDGIWNGTESTIDPSNGTNSGPVYDGPLPVDIVSFNGSADQNNVTLSWQTSWELNNDRFEIRRKINGSDNWVIAGSIRGAGNSNEIMNYSYTDNNLTSGQYEYKLVSIDYDGNAIADNSPITTVEVGVPMNFSVSQNYPNPFNPVTKIDFQLPVDALVNVKVYDMTGREVANIINEFKTAGYHTFQFDGSNLASGMYVYRISAGNFSSTKKMLMVK